MCPTSLLSTLLVTFVALEHLGFLVLEMFLWQKPLGRKVFRQTEESAAATAVLAKNQGLYNGFLAAGLIWSEVTGDCGATTFFLVCVIVAGLYGGWTVNKRIVFVQALPAMVALAVGCAACA
jgi:putative membrane protein